MSAAEPEDPLAHECPQCGSKRLSEELVRTAIWHGDRLVLVDGIPAVLCSNCSERFYDDETVTMLDLMRGDGFPAEIASEYVNVPVFRFARRAPRRPIKVAECETS